MIELITAIGVSAIIIVLASTVFYRLYQEKMRADFVFALTSIRISFQQSVINSQTWALTQSNTPAMGCFSGGTPAPCVGIGTTATDMVIYSGTTPLYDSTNATAGYTLEGLPCATYGAPGACVIKPHVTWLLQCNSVIDPTCLSPLVILNLNYAYNGPDVGATNLNSYGFQITKATFPVKSSTTCTGAVPPCTATQAAMCQGGSWVCEEFGL